MMKKILHDIYWGLGIVLCQALLVYWTIRDIFKKPTTKTVLFVAHPDDDTLFFHEFIKKNKPYVCLLTTGWSLRRMPCFFKTMNEYGVRFRAYPLKTDDDREDLIQKYIGDVLKIADFEVIGTHNKSGEYGHIQHARIHRCVCETIKKKKNKYHLYCPVEKDYIMQFPLSTDSINEKTHIFNDFYTTESWVLIENDEWVKHEQLQQIEYY